MNTISSAVSGTPPASRYNNLNFLRIVFAIMVIFSHSPQLIDGNENREYLWGWSKHQTDFGKLAVDGFFIISGYLIVKSWLSSANWRDYLTKRVLRIYPGFILAFLLSVFVVGALGAGDVHAYFAGLKMRELFLRILTLHMPPHSDTFIGLPFPQVNGSMWTILYEFGCYLLILLLGVLGLVRRPVVSGLLAISWLLYVYLDYSHALQPAPSNFIGDPSIWPRFLTFFLMGSCFYLYRECIVYHAGLAWLALAAILLSFWLGTGAVLTLPLCGTYLLLYAAFRPSERLSKVGTKVDLSYGLYLYAWPIQTLILWHFRSLSPWLLFLVASVLSAGMAWLSWHCVEKPALSLKKRPVMS